MTSEFSPEYTIVAIPFSKANIVTAQTDTDLVLPGGNTIAVMPKAGHVVSVSANLNAAITAGGNVTIEVHKDGTELAESAAPVLTLTTAVQESYASVRARALQFSAGDGLGVSYSSATDTTPTNTLDLDCILYVAFAND